MMMIAEMRLLLRNLVANWGCKDSPDDGNAVASSGAVLYATFVENELRNERDRRESLDSRAIAVITTSGAFVTLSFALQAVLVKSNNYVPSRIAVGFVVAALACFVAAAVCALVASKLVYYEVITPNQLDRFRGDKYWKDSEDNARWLLTAKQTRTIDTLRTGNNMKATRLEYALVLQIGAFLLLGTAVLVWLIRSMA